MLRDCREGKGDFIIVKSLSRFGRDTLETIRQIRALKEMGIGIYIEMGDINTMTINDSVLGLYAAFDQEESESRSKNIKFGLQRRMSGGRVILNHTQFLGYTKGADGILKIVPEEAAVVRKIFSLYVDGNGVRKIKCLPGGGRPQGGDLLRYGSAPESGGAPKSVQAPGPPLETGNPKLDRPLESGL